MARKPVLTFKKSSRFREATSSGLTVTRYVRGDEGFGTLGDIINYMAYQKCYKIFMRARYWSSSMIAGDWRSGLGFHHVTGNMYRSLGVAVVGANPKTGHLTVAAQAPANLNNFKASMSILGKGKQYPLDKYADGTVVADLGKPYKGETGLGAGQTGDSLRLQYINKIRDQQYAGGKSNMYTLYAFIAAPYASKVNIKKGESNNFFQSRIMPLLVEGMKLAIEERSW